MESGVMETVFFECKSEVTQGDFLLASVRANSYIESCQGFVARRLSQTDSGTWVEQIEWASLEDAQVAASGIGASAHTADFIAAIDGSSVRLYHSEIRVSLG